MCKKCLLPEMCKKCLPQGYMGIWVYWRPRSVAIGLPGGYMGNKASLGGIWAIRPPSMGIWVYG